MMVTGGVLRLTLLLGLGLCLAAPIAMAAEPVTVSGAQIGAAEGVTVVRIPLGEGSNPTVSPFRQTGPERLVIDIAGATLSAGSEAPSGGIVDRSEFAVFNDGTDNVRLTLFLTQEATWDIRNDDGVVVLTLRPGAVSDPLASSMGADSASDSARLSGPDNQPGGARLTTLDFQQRDRVSRVVIGAQDVDPEVTQPETGMIAIDLAGASMPESLQRELNTQFFYSAVDSVRAYPTRAGTRVAVRMRAGAEYSVKREGALTVVEIQVPADQVAAREKALQRSATAAPSEPATNGGEGLSNTGGGEVMISGSGKTMDPQSMYGTGTGTRTGRSALCYTGEVQTGAGRFTGRRMSIDLQDANIHTVFRFIADFGDVNIVSSDDVSGKVTVRLKDVPWDEGLAAVLQAKGLAAQCLGEIIRVAPFEQIKSEQQASLEAKRANEELEELSLYIAPLNYAQADELPEQIQGVLSGRGSVQVDARGNQLIIRDREDNIAQIRELLRRIDQPNRQVSIEARFVEANSNFNKALGIQWGGELNASAQTGYPTGAVFPNSVGVGGGIGTNGATSFYSPGTESLLVDLGPPSAGVGGISFALGSIPGLVDIDVRLAAVVSEGWGKIVSSPRVTALDNEAAKVVQGARIPYLSVSQNGTQVQFIEANLELEVTPHITSGDTVFLDIQLKNNRPDFGTTIQGQPAISQKTIDTRVLVPDGDTTVLGGVYQTSETFSTSRVPGFGDIPILGYLFKNSSNTRTQNEMLVFVTPHIVPIDETAVSSTTQ